MHLHASAISIISTAALTMAAVVPRADEIVGGDYGKIENFPYQISLQESGQHSCGGSIIDPTHIVTAAHCVYNMTASDFTVRAGSTDYDNGGQLVDVSAVVSHPDYNPDTTDFDIAIVTLADELEFGDGVASIELVDSDAGLPDEGTVCVVSGWGATEEGGSASPTLQYLEETVLNRDQCAQNYNNEGYQLTDSMFCAGFFTAGKDSCQGDSGGPLVDTDKGLLIGVVSWGLGCARKDYPGVYASISKLRQFITDNSGI